MHYRGGLGLVCFFFLATFWAAAQPPTRPGDALLGEWHTEEGKGKVVIYRGTDGKYYGKITWLKEPFETDGSRKLDSKNPESALRSRPIEGIAVLRGFDYDADDREWENGRIYDPETGNDYRCLLVLESPNRLKLRGYIGISLIGRTTYWTR